MGLADITRRIPHFKGKFRLVRFLFKSKLKREKDVVISGRDGLVYKLPNLVENIGFEIFADGEYEPDTIRLITDKIPAQGVLIDIGANIGSIAVPVCRKRPDIKAVCIEASPRVFSYLESNISLNGLTNCLPVNKIVSDKDGEEVDFFSPEELFGKGSTAPVFTSVPEKAKTTTLDQLLVQMNITEAHFIKIDIEGYEYFAFKGGEGLLSAANAPDILFEFLDWAEGLVKGIVPGQAQELLLQYGYRLYAIDKNSTLKKIDGFMKKGEAMIFATKKDIK